MFWLVWSSIVSSAASSIFDHCVGCELFGGCGTATMVFGDRARVKPFSSLTLCPVSTWPTYHQNHIVIITVFAVAHGNLL